MNWRERASWPGAIGAAILGPHDQVEYTMRDFLAQGDVAHGFASAKPAAD